MSRRGASQAPVAAAGVGLLGASVGAAALLSLVQLSDPLGGVARLGLPPVGQVQAEAANRLIEAAWPDQNRELLTQARLAARRELSLSPASGHGWLRLAIIEAALAERLDEAALDALSRSYAVAPLDSRLLEARIRFSYDHWGALTPDLRRQTLAQIDQAWPRRAHRLALFRAFQQVSDPGGRLALRTKLLSLDRQARTERLRSQRLQQGAAST